MSSASRIGMRLAAVGALAAFAFACADGPTEVPEVEGPAFAKASTQEGPELAGHHVVMMSGAGPADLAGQVAALGGTVGRVHPEIGMATVTGLDVDGIAGLASVSGVQDVVPDYLLQWTPELDEADFEAMQAGVAGHLPGHDPADAFFFPCQWNMTQCNAEGAWMQGQFGDPDVKVAVLDTGVDPLHIDMQGRIDLTNSTSMLSSSSICDLYANDVGTINDYRFHGAFVSGIIAANGLGVTGVAPRTQIVGVKVLNCLGSGSFADLIAGVIYAANLPDVGVINMSLGVMGGVPKNLPGAGQLVAALNKAVNYAGSKGKLVVSSAGNDGLDMDHSKNVTFLPAESGSGIAAWAGDIDGNLASYSNFGRSGTWVGAGGGDFNPGAVPLPGCALENPLSHSFVTSVCSSTSLFFNCAGGVWYLYGGSGTSFSAPLVSGVAALVDGMHGGSRNGGQLKTTLSRTADDIGRKGVDALFSHGRVNAGNAVGN